MRDPALLDEKRAVRRSMRRTLMAIDAKAHTSAGEVVADALAAVVDALGEGPVAVFASLPHEIDTAPLDAMLAGRGRTRLLPTIVDDALVFRALPTWRAARELPRDGLGIPTPDDGCPIVSLAHAVVVFVPGCAFDDDGARLGWGRGYYDRALATLEPSTPTIALLHDVQRIARVPRDQDDVPVAVTCAPGGTRIHRPLPPHVESAIHAAFPRRDGAV